MFVEKLGQGPAGGGGGAIEGATIMAFSLQIVSLQAAGVGLSIQAITCMKALNSIVRMSQLNPSVRRICRTVE